MKYLRPVPAALASGLVADVYRQLDKDFLIAAPLVLHSQCPPLLAAAWSLLRETSIAAGRVPRAHKEAIATGVSEANACPYCVEAHTLMLDGARANGSAKAAAEFASWGRRSLDPNDPIVRQPPFGAEEVAEVVGTAVTFHYINRMVTLFLVQSPLPVPPALRWLRGAAGRAGAATFGRRITSLAPEPGASLSLLPPAPLPADLQWAAGDPAVMGAVARAADIAEAAGRTALSAAARGVVTRRLATWRGEAPGLGRGWVNDEVKSLDEADRPLAAFALLAALAPYQVDECVVAQFRTRRPSDLHLLGAAAWASFTAARRVGTWLAAA